MSIDKRNFVKAKMRATVSPSKALKILREWQELSQADLAEITGVSQSNISAIENGSKQIGRERAIIFARALRVHPSVLLFPDFDISDFIEYPQQ